MKKFFPMLLILVAALVLTFALAGEPVKKCPLPTQECLDKMAAKLKQSGWVGIEFDIDEKTGVRTIIRVIKDSPAEKAGLQPGDILVALNGVEFSKDNSDKLKKVTKEWSPGQSITYTVKREGAARQISLTLAPMPADVLARFIGEHMLEHASVAVASTGK